MDGEDFKLDEDDDNNNNNSNSNSNNNNNNNIKDFDLDSSWRKWLPNSSGPDEGTWGMSLKTHVILVSLWMLMDTICSMLDALIVLHPFGWENWNQRGQSMGWFITD